MQFIQLTCFGLISFTVCNVIGVPVADNTDYNNQYSDDQAYDYNYDDSYPENNEDDQGEIYDPIIKTKPKKIAVQEGTTINLPCHVEKKLGGNVVMWFKDSLSNQIAMGNSIVNGDERATVTSVDAGKDAGSVLLIGVATPKDEGTYVCQIANQKKTEVRHVVTIVSPPSVEISSPGDGKTLSMAAKDILTAKKGDDVTLTCEGKGTPTPTITWTRLGNKEKMPDGSAFRTEPQIMYTSVTRMHEGTYKCTASNAHGHQASKSIKVVIEYEPEIEVEEVFIHSQTGDSVELVCKVHAVPKPTVVWRKNGEKINAEDHANIEIKHHGSKHTLSIEKVEKENYGTYHCEAKNTLGKGEKKLEISGNAKAAKFLTEPSGEENTTFNLEWSAMSFNPITKFMLEYRTGDEGDWTDIEINPDDNKHPYHKSGKHYFENLQGATNYQARVKSETSDGWSKYSPIFAFATKGAAPRSAKTVADNNGNNPASSLYSSLLTVIFAVYLSLSIRQN